MADRDDALAQALAELERRDKAIDTLTRVGAWAEDDAERLRLRGLERWR